MVGKRHKSRHCQSRVPARPKMGRGGLTRNAKAEHLWAKSILDGTITQMIMITLDSPGKNQAGKKTAAEWWPEIATGKHSHPGGESHHVRSKNLGIKLENSQKTARQTRNRTWSCLKVEDPIHGVNMFKTLMSSLKVPIHWSHCQSQPVFQVLLFTISPSTRNSSQYPLFKSCCLSSFSRLKQPSSGMILFKPGSGPNRAPEWLLGWCLSLSQTACSFWGPP